MTQMQARKCGNELGGLAALSAALGKTSKGDLGSGDLAAGGLRGPEQPHVCPKPNALGKANEAEAPPTTDTPTDVPAPPAPNPATPREIRFQGIPVVLDRPKGFIQAGRNESTGEVWAREYKNDYGYVPSTLGGDGEGLDVFVGDDMEATEAHWIIQTKEDGAFDEYKLMLGFANRAAAKAAYLAHIPAQFFGSISTTSIEMIKALLGIEPSLVIKAAIAGLRAEFKRKGSYVGQLKAWAAKRALTEQGPSGCAMEKAVTQIANAVGEAAEGLSTLIMRSMTSYVCDSWDAVSAMFTEPGDVAKAQAAVAANADALAHIAVTLLDATTANAGKAPMTPDVWAALFAQNTSPPATTAKPEKKPVPALGGPVAGSVLAPLSIVPTAKAFVIDAGSISTETAGRIAAFMTEETGAATTLITGGTRMTFAHVPRSATLKDLRGRFVDVRKDVGEGELRYTLAIVLEPDVVDAQGDTYSADEIRKTAWLYMTQYRNVGLQHKALVNGLVELVESYIAAVDQVINGVAIKAGTWLIGHHYNDDNIWAQVKSGELTGLSIAGFAQREEL